MRRKFFHLLAAATASLTVIAGTASLAAAQSRPAPAAMTFCGERGSLVKILQGVYQERQQGFGLANETAIFELFVGPEGSWTLFATMTGGVSCIIGYGEDWQHIDVAQPEMSESG